MQTEILGTSNLKLLISRSDLLSADIAENDKGISWDGYINVYKTRKKSQTKDNLLFQVPIQVKAHEEVGNNNDYKYDVEISDLRNYQGRGGTLFFKICFDHEGKNEKIYYNALLPGDIIDLLKKTSGKHTKRIQLSPFPSQISDVENILTIFAKAMKQHTDGNTYRWSDFFTSTYPVNNHSTIEASHAKISFQEYYSKANKAYGKMKTLLYTTEARSVEDFYVCNSLSNDTTTYKSTSITVNSRDNTSDSSDISNPSLEILFQKSHCVLLTGAAGIGKSMLLRHFLLEEITKNKEMDTLPVIILLREFNAENPDISVMILNAIQKIAPGITGHVLIETLIAGKAKLLFDGIDEIRERDIGVLIEALERFVLLYPENQFIVTSRKYSSFVELNQFVVFQVMPLSKSQALSLISRLEYMPESPGIKADFMFRLENEYYRTHEEFASNPLLLTLMLLTFHRFSRLPHKKYIFYEEAYATLLQGHDSHNKPGFQREYLSVDEPSEFTFVFRELCARSYREADYEFNRRKMEQYFALLWSAKELQSQQITSSGRAKMSFPHFLTDSTKNTGLLFEEGGIIYFLHRSFQEYFFADYYARTDDASLLRLGRFLQQPNQSDFDEGEAFEMLYDMSKNKVERFIFLPYLTTLLDKKTEKEAYWSFLSSGFNYLHYRVQNNVALDQYFPKSTGRRTPFVIQFLLSLRSKSKVLSWIINAAKIKLESTDVEIVKQSIDEESFCHSSFQQTNFYIQHGTAANSYHIQTVPTRVAVPERQKETYVLDSNNDLVSFGGDYHFPCSFGTNNFSGHYSEIIEAVEAPKFPLWKVFHMLNDYFHTIKKRYEHAGDIDLSF